MEAVCPSEMSVKFYHTTQHCVLEYRTLKNKYKFNMTMLTTEYRNTTKTNPTSEF
jgi:hypothetical protein